MSSNSKGSGTNMLKTFWNSLTPRKQMSIVIFGIGLGVLLFGIIGYRFKDKPAPVASAEKTHELSLDPKLLERSKYSESEKELTNQKNDLKDMKAQLEQMQKDLITEAAADPSGKPGSAGANGANGAKNDLIVKGLLGKPKTAKQASPIYPTPPPPVPGADFSAPPPLPSGDPSRSVASAPTYNPVVESIGDIEVVSNSKPSTSNDKQQAAVQSEDKKKDSQSVYLPPSFMEATLLSGLDAPVVDAAKNNPVPVLLRIKTPAVLPNKVKAQLTGCFVISEGYGQLSDERAHLRIVSLSCLSKKGEAVIDQPLSGFVVDSDSKVGLRGHVVSKMGSTIARSMMAGFFAGVGDAVKSSSSTTAVSALGATSTIDPKNVATAGLGQGLSSGAQKLQEFFLELAKQTMPVIEVGATRTVTLVVNKGTNLEIKEINTSFNKSRK